MDISDESSKKDKNKKTREIIRRLLKKESFVKSAERAKKRFKSFNKKKTINTPNEFIVWYKSSIYDIIPNTTKWRPNYEIEFRNYIDKFCGELPYKYNTPSNFSLSILIFIFFNKIKTCNYFCGIDFNEEYGRIEISIEPEATQRDVLKFIQINWKEIRKKLNQVPIQFFEKRIRETQYSDRDHKIYKMYKKGYPAKKISEKIEGNVNPELIRQIIKREKESRKEV